MLHQRFALTLLGAVCAFLLSVQAFAQTDVANLAELRTKTADAVTVYRVTGIVVVTVRTGGLNTGGNRHQLYVQDTSGADGQTAIMIDDPAYALAADYQIGDQLQYLTGTLTIYSQMLELTPTAAATMTGTTTPPAPLVVNALSDFSAIEAELIRINGAQSSTVGNWTANGNYTLAAPVGPVTTIRIEDACELVGTAIPAELFNMIGVAVRFNLDQQIEPRLSSDLIIPPPVDNPNADLGASGLTFGPLNTNSTQDLTIQITNSATSSVNLTINSPGFTITGANPAQFSVVPGATFPIVLTPSQSTTLSLRYTSGPTLGVIHGASATLVSNDPNNPVVVLSGSTANQVVANLAALRAIGVTANVVLVTGTCVVTAATNSLNAGRNQLYIQDTSGADGQTGIVIDDLTFKMGRTFALGDQISNVSGTLTDFNFMLELTAAGSATFVGTTTPPAPLVVTPAITDFETIEGELIRLNTFSVDTSTLGTTWLANTNFPILTPSTLLNQVRIEDNSQLVGTAIPPSLSLIGLAVQGSASNYQIQPRFTTDIPGASRVVDWILYQ